MYIYIILIYSFHLIIFVKLYFFIDIISLNILWEGSITLNWNLLKMRYLGRYNFGIACPVASIDHHARWSWKRFFDRIVLNCYESFISSMTNKTLKIIFMQREAETRLIPSRLYHKRLISKNSYLRIFHFRYIRCYDMYLDLLALVQKYLSIRIYINVDNRL